MTCFPSHPQGCSTTAGRRGTAARQSRGSTSTACPRSSAPIVRVRATHRELISLRAGGGGGGALRLGRFDGIVATSPQFFRAVAGGLAGPVEADAVGVRAARPVAGLDRRRGRRAAVARHPMLEKPFELALYRHARGVVCVTPASWRTWSPGASTGQAGLRAEWGRRGVLGGARRRRRVACPARLYALGRAGLVRGDDRDGPWRGHGARRGGAPGGATTGRALPGRRGRGTRLPRSPGRAPRAR